MTRSLQRRLSARQLADRNLGLSLVEVLVALAVVALVAAALLGLQATSLRAARSAARTRTVAAVLEYEAVMARHVTPATGTCGSAAGLDGTCTVTVECLSEPIALGGCAVRLVRIDVETDGQRVGLATVSHAALESAHRIHAPPGGEP